MMGNERLPEVVLIPHEYPEASTLDAIAKAFRELRLRALQTDPASFSSPYASESQRGLEFWTKRIQEPQAKQFALLYQDSAVVDYHHPGTGYDKPWHGMLVLLGPKPVSYHEYDNGSTWKTILTEKSFKVEDPRPMEATLDASSEDSALAYHIVAVYVAPEARRKGLAKSLMKAAATVLEQETEKLGYRRAICTIGVARGNAASQRTYENSGFVTVAEDDYTSEDGREFHESVMRRDFLI
jgi:ribosomal protein S18 acetylase RimI-like enzyme